MNTELAKYIIDNFDYNNYKTVVELTATKLKLAGYKKPQIPRNIPLPEPKMEWLYVLPFMVGENIVPRIDNNMMILECPSQSVGFTNRPFKFVNSLDLNQLAQKWQSNAKNSFKNSPPNAAIYIENFGRTDVCIITINNMTVNNNLVNIHFDYVNSIDNQCVIPPRFEKGVLFIDSDNANDVEQVIIDIIKKRYECDVTTSTTLEELEKKKNSEELEKKKNSLDLFLNTIADIEKELKIKFEEDIIWKIHESHNLGGVIKIIKKIK